MEPKNSRLAIWLPLLLSLMLVLGMFIGNLVKNNGSSQLPLKVFSNPDKISSILSYIEQNYVDSVSRQKITEEIIETVLRDLDPHSIYIPPQNMAEVNESLRGNFDGIGVQFNMVNDTVLVIKPVEGGPSDMVGIQSGDRIIMVDSVNVAGVKMPEDSIVSRLKGPRGSEVQVGVYRRGEPETLFFNITRGVIPVASIDVAYMVTPEIGFIKINTFSQTTYNEFTAALNDLREHGMTSLIIDLRGNSGGIMEPAIRIADEFLEKGQMIVYTEGHARKREEYKATGRGLGESTKLAILIDEGSASASEIIAGAIQDNDRGWIIGRRSFGKGLVQEQAMLNDGSALRLTTARYFTPTGRSIQKSYTNGNDDYYLDIARRFRHGELLAADSIQFDDSLKYTTAGGRTVYGGGGIMPDFFVPYDTTGITTLFMRLNHSGSIYRYALNWADDHRHELSAFTKAREIDVYLDRQNVIGQFRKYLEKNGHSIDDKQWSESTLIVSTQLKAYIARNILDNAGFYPIIEAIDNTLTAARDFMQQQ